MQITANESKRRFWHGIDWSKFQQITKFVFPLLLFTASLLPRVMDLVARSNLWHHRAGLFINSILRQEWAGTALAPHPGVPTMWLAGLAQLVARTSDPAFKKQLVSKQMAIEMIPLAFVISMAIVLAYYLLSKIFDRHVAAAATLLLALSPFHILITKTLHVDGLMSVFVMVSVCWLWLYIVPAGQGRRRYLVFSGLFAGLALLSKAPSLFLAPYLFLTLGTWQLSVWYEKRNEFSLRRDWLRPIKEIGKASLIWIGVAVAVYILFWPALWTQPVEALDQVFKLTKKYTETPHPNPVYFMGAILEVDPGPLFYPIYIVIKTTAITLPFFLISPVWLFSRMLDRSRRLILFLALAFIFFFTLQMTIGDKKFARYLLPTYQFIVIMAGISAVYFFRWLSRGRKLFLNLSLVLVIGIQAAITLPRHPYYGTHFNILAGGPRSVLEKGIVPGQEQGEGIDIAAEYLNSLTCAVNIRVASQIPASFDQYFVGSSVSLDDVKAGDVDYLVFARNIVNRSYSTDVWGQIWKDYKDKEPDLQVDFDGLPYAWVYQAENAIDELSISNDVEISVGDAIRLVRYDIKPQILNPGDTVRLTLVWEANQKPSLNYRVFTHVRDEEGILRGQKDGEPKNNHCPTNMWEVGDHIADSYDIKIASDAPPGSYEIAVGLYDLMTGERLPMIAKDGSVLPLQQYSIYGLEIVPELE